MPVPFNVRSTLRSLVVAALAAALAAAGSEPSVLNEVRKPPFAWPWEISFTAIGKAMTERNYELDQVRRVLDRQNPNANPTNWVSVLEHLKHKGSPGQPESYELTFAGIENVTLPPPAFNLQSKQFAEIAGFLFNFQSFRVLDGPRAAQNYTLAFVGAATRIGRPVYRMTAFSPLGQRSSWVLELDVATGYPLYRAEYDLWGRMVSEVEVTSFDDTFNGAVNPAPDPFATQSMVNAKTALAAIGLSQRHAPGVSVIPAGYAPLSSKVLTDPLSADQKAVLAYTDGIDQLFVIEAHDTRASLLPGNALTAYHDAAGTTQCSFVDRGVEYLLVGREDTVVRTATHALYAQVARRDT